MLVWCDIQTKMAPYYYMLRTRYELTLYVGLLYFDIYLLLQLVPHKMATLSPIYKGFTKKCRLVLTSKKIIYL